MNKWMNGGTNRVERAAHCYSFLLHLYPRQYRDVFGAPMLQTFKDHYRDASDHAGGVGIAFWLAVLGDEINGIVREQIMTFTVRRILPILLALGLIEFAAVVTFTLKQIPALLLVVLIGGALFAILAAALLLITIVRAGGRQRAIALTMVVGIGALSIFGVQSSVRGANTNTWCTTVHPTASHPPTTLATATDYFTQGEYDYDRGDCDRAVADYSEAITRDPSFAEAYNNRAYTYMMQQDYARALPDLDRAIQLRPDYVHALMNRGDIYNYDYTIDRGRAIADYDRVIALGPEAIRDTSVCGHRFLAVHDGWNLGTILDIAHAGC